jgi:uncharacterized DUF497 family protein
MKQTPDFAKAEANMQAGVITADGFLGEDTRPLTDIIEHDEESFASLGLDFDEVAVVLESGATLTFEDRRFDYGEERFVTLGLLRGQVVVVVSNESEDRCRIISMRRATGYEQELYFESIG